MASTDGINNPKQPDPTSPDYWTTPGLDEEGIDLTDPSDPTQAVSNVNKDELLREKAKYEGQLERMSQGNPARADIEKHIQDLDAQLATADTSSDWDPNAPEDEDPQVINPTYSEDSVPSKTDKKTKTATYTPADDETITIHSNPGNATANNYETKPPGAGTVTLEIFLESKNDPAKVEVVNGEYVIHVKGAKGEETYKIAENKLKTIRFQNSGENKIDTSALTPAQEAKIQIGDNPPKWADQLILNLSKYDENNLQGASTLINEIPKAAKSGDWKGVTDFLKTDSKMLQPNEANDIVRKVLSAIVEPILSKEVDKIEGPIQSYVTSGAGHKGINPRDDKPWVNALIAIFSMGSAAGADALFNITNLASNPGASGGEVGDSGYLNWEHNYNYKIHIRNSIGDDVKLAKRVAIEFYADKLPPELKTKIVETLKLLPKEVLTLMRAGLTSEKNEKHMGDRFSTEDWDKLLQEASIAS